MNTATAGRSQRFCGCDLVMTESSSESEYWNISQTARTSVTVFVALSSLAISAIEVPFLAGVFVGVVFTTLPISIAQPPTLAIRCNILPADDVILTVDPLVPFCRVIFSNSFLFFSRSAIDVGFFWLFLWTVFCGTFPAEWAPEELSEGAVCCLSLTTAGRASVKTSPDDIPSLSIEMSSSSNEADTDNTEYDFPLRVKCVSSADIDPSMRSLSFIVINVSTCSSSSSRCIIPFESLMRRTTEVDASCRSAASTTKKVKE